MLFPGLRQNPISLLHSPGGTLPALGLSAAMRLPHGSLFGVASSPSWVSLFGEAFSLFPPVAILFVSFIYSLASYFERSSWAAAGSPGAVCIHPHQASKWLYLLCASSLDWFLFSANSFPPSYLLNKFY